MMQPDSDTTEPEDCVKYRYNGHEFVVVEEYGDDELVECRECLIREVMEADDDPEDRLKLLTPECHIEWLREPDGGYHGQALRSASGFSGRELIGVNSDGEVVDSVRIYDKDAHRLTSILDASTWDEMKG